jgi:hypothetical protein
MIPGENALGFYSFSGRYNATNYGVGAYIVALGGGSAWSSTNYDSYLSINTANPGSITPTEKARFSSTGLAVTGAVSATVATGNNICTFKAAQATKRALVLIQGAPSSDGDPLGDLQFANNDSTNYAYIAGYRTGGATSSSMKLVTVSAGVEKHALLLNPTGTVQAHSTISVGNATPSASGAGITFPATVSASTDVNTLDDYDEYTAASAACTGAITTAAVWKLTKVGNKVTLTLPGVTGAGVATDKIQFGTAIPAKYRSSASLAVVSCPIKDNAALQATPGAIYIEASSGLIQVFKDGTFGGSNFTVTALAGIQYSTSVSWTI